MGDDEDVKLFTVRYGVVCVLVVSETRPLDFDRWHMIVVGESSEELHIIQ